MYISGGFEIEGEMRDNIKQPKAIMLNDPTAKVGMVEGADASGSFKTFYERFYFTPAGSRFMLAIYYWYFFKTMFLLNDRIILRITFLS